jgi:hypothetical protein
MDKLERFNAAARECARPPKAKRRPFLPWWVAIWWPWLGSPWRVRLLFVWLKVRHKL